MTEISQITAYRAGSLDALAGIVLSDTPDGALCHPAADGDQAALYEVAFHCPLVLRNQLFWLAEQEGVAHDEIVSRKRACLDPAAWQRDLDCRIQSFAWKAGFDAVIYEEPLSFASRKEVVVYSRDQLTLRGLCDEFGEVKAA